MFKLSPSQNAALVRNAEKDIEHISATIAVILEEEPTTEEVNNHVEFLVKIRSEKYELIDALKSRIIWLDGNNIVGQKK
ncbi:MAG: hypothetical protein E6017_14225 [Kluyvera cryocrescens]|nr:hypothetical protein [Kluyvera cryocrescens]